MTSLSRRSFLTGSAGVALATTLPRAWGSPLSSAPRGVHVSLTGDAVTSRTITWQTDGLASPGSVVQWGPVTPGTSAVEVANAPLPFSVTGTSATAPGVEVLTHRVDLTNLPPATAVRYRVGSPGAFGPVHVMTPTPLDGRFRFVHLGDHGTNANSLRTTAALVADRPDLVLVAGDLCYADGRQEVWDTWFDQVQPLAASTPLMAAPGNHESKDFGGDAFKKRLSYPGRGSFYSFDYGRVHVTVGTGGVFLADGLLAEELAFLETDLAAAAVRRAAGEIDFVVVVQHYPLWTNEEDRGPLNPSLVLTQEHIYQRHQIDLLLVGHDHFYERSVRMAYGQVSPEAGYVQVISGGGGKSLYDFVPDDSFQEWSAGHSKRYHHVVYDVSREAITGSVVATDGQQPALIDTFTVPRRLAADLDVRVARPSVEVLKPLSGVSVADLAATFVC